MKTTLMLLAVVGLIAGCSTPPPPAATVYDPVTGQRTDLMENLLEAPGTPREVVYLNSFREIGSYGKQPRYYFQVKYLASAEVGYLEIPPGQTLTLVADGQPIKLDGTGSVNLRKDFQQQDTAFVTESAIYPVSKSDLQRLGYARNIKVQVKGVKGLVEREFNQSNYDNFRAFVTRAAL